MVEEMLYKCAHCKETGTCTNGPDESSCAACVKSNELKKGTYVGLACGSCGGLGRTDTLTRRLNDRIGPLLALTIVVVFATTIILSSVLNSPHSSEVITLSGSLIGAVTGFYFGGKQDKGTPKG